MYFVIKIINNEKTCFYSSQLWNETTEKIYSLVTSTSLTTTVLSLYLVFKNCMHSTYLPFIFLMVWQFGKKKPFIMMSSSRIFYCIDSYSDSGILKTFNINGKHVDLFIMCNNNFKHNFWILNKEINNGRKEFRHL